MTSTNAAEVETVELLNANTGRSDGRLARPRYETMRAALLKVIPDTEQGVAYLDLKERVKPLLPDWWHKEGWSVAWHIAVVKLDLEARGLIANVDKARPMHVRRTGS